LPSHRYILYCNEMVGLGHVRRSLAIAAHLADADDDATALILTGAEIEPVFRLPPGVDTVKLPARSRDENGVHRAQRLHVGIEDLQALRADIALASATAFRPHVAVVDKLPLGLGGELEPTLRALRARGDCRLVLGLRDIEDSPGNVRRLWGPELRAAIEELYDAVLVYGPPETMDAFDCVGWHDLDVPVFHVGYVGADMPTTAPPDLSDEYVVATAGGGSDGYRLLATFAEALRLRPLPCRAVVVTGPLMDAARRSQIELLLAGTDAQVWPYRPDMERVIAGARGVVAMAGYNTVSEVMRARKPALLVPRVRPSREQLGHAEQLARRGLQDMLHPDRMTPARMRAALDRLLARRRPDFDPHQYDGAQRAGTILRELAGAALPLLRPHAVAGSA
jgi:predicted glycosyltransferase